MRKLFMYCILSVATAALVACAAIQPPFATPEEVAIKRALTEQLARYPGLVITVSGDRVYLEGEVLNKTELDNAIEVARGTEGITSVMDDVYLIEVGSMGGDNDGWD